MKFIVNDLGPIKHAELVIGGMTVICGRNNSGKTYITHALYGFLDYLATDAPFPAPAEAVSKLMSDGAVTLDMKSYAGTLQRYLNTASKRFSDRIHRVFGGSEKQFSETRVRLQLDNKVPTIDNRFKVIFGSAKKSFLQVEKGGSPTELRATLIVDKTAGDALPSVLIERMLGNSIRSVMFRSLFPKPFISSAERTGSAIFQKELDFTRNRLIEMLGDKASKFKPTDLLGNFSADYPTAVRRNVDFIRNLPNITGRESYLMREHQEILHAFKDIIGGEFKVGKDGDIHFVPQSSRRMKLSLVESSSAVRSLLDIGFYLRHVAERGDLLMVDEPELNLHPENQRRVARLFSRLSKVGIRVFMTTHSDYILKEFNTLIMLNHGGEKLAGLASREHYQPGEFLDPATIRVYTAKEELVLLDGRQRRIKCHTLVPARVDPANGYEVESFDDTIDEMNRIQEEIIWGDHG
ncbi:MAG: AAA family ATPase [Candidatus Sumerlaeia bacterium]|nr:AAA family ATPase [Candidatus Sumerlaeia bacterium]